MNDDDDIVSPLYGTPPRSIPLLLTQSNTSLTNVPSTIELPDIEEIRSKLQQLAASDKIEKKDALTMMSLFHAMESLLRHECGVRDKMILETKACLERNRLETECERLARKQTLEMQQQHVTNISSRRR